jgi:hypothetical protein
VSRVKKIKISRERAPEVTFPTHRMYKCSDNIHWSAEGLDCSQMSDLYIESQIEQAKREAARLLVDVGIEPVSNYRVPPNINDFTDDAVFDLPAQNSSLADEMPKLKLGDIIDISSDAKMRVSTAISHLNRIFVQNRERMGDRTLRVETPNNAPISFNSSEVLYVGECAAFTFKERNITTYYIGFIVSITKNAKKCSSLKLQEKKAYTVQAHFLQFVNTNSLEFPSDIGARDYDLHCGSAILWKVSIKKEQGKHTYTIDNDTLSKIMATIY